MNTTKTKGDTAELAVAADMMRQGYRIAFPFGDEWKYDLIATKDGKDFIRVQVKYVTPKEGVVVVRLTSTTIRAGRAVTTTRYTEEDVDLVVAYNSETGRCYYIDPKELGGTQLMLRLEPTKNGQAHGIRWASDYEDLRL